MQELFTLIKSLKPSEKRYFTLTANVMTPSKKTNYLRLYNAIESMDIYDEEELLKKNRHASFVKNLAVYKNQLYNFILESLRNYNEENIEEWIIKKAFLKIQLLFNKGLDRSCEKLMIKTKEHAWQYEQYYILLDILDLQLFMFGNCRIGQFNESYFKQMEEEKNRVIEYINQFNDVLINWHKLNLLFINKAENAFVTIKQKASEIIYDPVMTNLIDQPLPLSTRNRYLACYELYYKNVNDVVKCYEYNKLLIENRILIDAQMPNFAIDPMAIYFNYMIACFNVGKWEEMEIYLQKTRSYVVTFIQQEIRRSHNSAYCGILLYLAIENYSQAALLVDEFLMARKKYEGRYRQDFLIFTMTQVGWYYFITKQYDNARSIWREITQAPNYAIEIESQATTRLYQLALYYEEGEYLLLDAEATNSRRYIKQKMLMDENEAFYLSAMSRLKGTMEDQAVFNQVLESILATNITMTEKSIFNRFLLSWIESKAGVSTKRIIE